jgi:hemin uptake protein HemP
MSTAPSSAVTLVPPDALFQVGDQEPVSLAHLERVNPAMTAESRALVYALRPGKTVTITHDGASVRVRRTR